MAKFLAIHPNLHELPMQDHQAICKELNAIVHRNWAGRVSHGSELMLTGNGKMIPPIAMKTIIPATPITALAPGRKNRLKGKTKPSSIDRMMQVVMKIIKKS